MVNLDTKEIYTILGNVSVIYDIYIYILGWVIVHRLFRLSNIFWPFVVLKKNKKIIFEKKYILSGWKHRKVPKKVLFYPNY